MQLDALAARRDVRDTAAHLPQQGGLVAVGLVQPVLQRLGVLAARTPRAPPPGDALTNAHAHKPTGRVAPVVDETEPGKGRATPTRREAEAARKKQMKTPMSRKEQRKRDAAAREEIRLKQRAALKSGDERYLPAREQGPVRRFCRDYVDRRYNVAEFLLPFLIVLLILFAVAGSMSSSVSAFLTVVIYPVVILTTVLDEFLMVRGLRRELKARFGPDAVKGSVLYAVLRSTQLRRFRLPKPQVARGEKLGTNYR
ncbi:DUF3043 domain-containing protein [Aeromicrobium chenweiae]|nr:DUF3043 domain-containing protein [Aeromicrobium chenweiae]